MSPASHEAPVKRGSLIAFEGVDGSGKTTQVARLAAALRAAGERVVTTREPTDGPFGRRIRAMARSGQLRTPDEELGWFVEDRRQHVKDTLAPALDRGEVVITDRYFLSTVAYQGARGHDAARLLEQSEQEFPLPDLVVLLEILPAEGLTRVGTRGGGSEPAFEDRDTLERVAAIFRWLDRDYIERIDASEDPDAVHARALEAVTRRLALGGSR